jgi:osmotically-inducible protein OsmY
MLTNDLNVITNEFGVITNEFGVLTNQFSFLTNEFGVVTNQVGAGAATSPGGTNSSTVTSFPSTTTTQAGQVARDIAFTPSDTALLNAVRQHVATRVQVAGPASPVHFLVQGGTVIVVGAVANPTVKQIIDALVSQTPGVTGVVDELTVGSATQSGTVTGMTTNSVVTPLSPIRRVPSSLQATNQ